MSAEPLFLDCDLHGKGIAANVCGHLVRNNGRPLGFVENSADPNNPQGWCYACEYVFQQENDRTVRFRAFTNMVLVCSACYAEIKARHDIEP